MDPGSLAAVECPAATPAYLAGLSGGLDEVAHVKGFITVPWHVVQGTLTFPSGNGNYCCD